MHLSVHLRDSGFDDETRTAAEDRYYAKLVRLLNSEAEAIDAYQHWDALTESDQTVTDKDKAFGKHWQEVIKECTAAGFKGQTLPEGFEGFFEIRVAR